MTVMDNEDPADPSLHELRVTGAPKPQTRSQALAAAGFTRRPGLWAVSAREALELIAAPMRPDGTWNRDREACRQIAAEALGRYDSMGAADPVGEPAGEATQDANKLRGAAQALQDSCHGAAYNAGWWHDLKTGIDLTNDYMADGMQSTRNIGELLCLVHSEISEAMEGARKRLPDDKLPTRPMLEVELADAVIRIFDMAGGLYLDLPGAIVEKLAYNASRLDHKREHRAAVGGKSF